MLCKVSFEILNAQSKGRNIITYQIHNVPRTLKTNHSRKEEFTCHGNLSTSPLGQHKKMWDTILSITLISNPTNTRAKIQSRFLTLCSIKTWISSYKLGNIQFKIINSCKLSYLFKINLHSHLGNVKFFMYNIPRGISESSIKIKIKTLVIVVGTLLCMCYNLFRIRHWNNTLVYSTWCTCKRILLNLLNFIELKIIFFYSTQQSLYPLLSTHFFFYWHFHYWLVTSLNVTITQSSPISITHCLCPFCSYTGYTIILLLAFLYRLPCSL